MIRTCDGVDDLLQRQDGAPCNCGLTFDDVDRYVIYPHEAIPPRLTDAQVEAYLTQLRSRE